MRARTLSGLSSFLLRSLGLSGSRCPSAHCPSPRGRPEAVRPRTVRGCGALVVAVMSAVLHSWWTRFDAPDREPRYGAADVNVRKIAGAGSRARRIYGGRRSASRTHCAAHATVVDVSAADQPQRCSMHVEQCFTLGVATPRPRELSLIPLFLPAYGKSKSTDRN